MTPETVTNRAKLDFEPEALRETYRREREKRLTREGTAQYRHIDGALVRYLDDPYAGAPIVREPVLEEMDVVVIGGGFGGLMAAARLREAGVVSLRIVEKADGFGGAWYWNRYPGVACDIESYIYMPLLEEVGYMPVEKYARGPEILRHSRAIGLHFNLYDGALFRTEVTEVRWEEETARWVVSTDRGDTLKARFICMSTGPLHRPKLPGVAGAETFKGHAFHTSRWDYEYTGGDTHGRLTGLADKTVGIIGTGASAVQCVPHLGESARHLYVFQRTPSSIDVRNNRPTDIQWAGSLEPGWQKRRMVNFNILVSGGQQDEDLVSDGWTDIFRNIDRAFSDSPAAAEEARQLADFMKMEQIRARVDQVVTDGAVAERLKPYYNQLCKRPCFHDDYLATFNRSNVTLVDTRGQGVERITETGVVAGGREYALDCLIYATGFEFQTEYASRVGYEIYGRGGQSLTEKQRDGISTLHGMHSHGFPNCYIIGNAQQANTPNFTHMLDEVSQHIAYIVNHCLKNQVRTAEASAEAEEAWVADVLSFAERRRKFDEECTPGYYNNEGMPSERNTRASFFAGGPVLFIKMMEDWRAEGEFRGLTLTSDSGGPNR